jgi:hypothetical protein
MADWKRPLFLGLGWGLGTALGLTILGGAILWYQGKPKPPTPWNTAAITAEYDYALTEGSNDDIVVFYTLENTTDFDYRADEGHDVTMSAELLKENSLVPFTAQEKIDYPVFVPAKKRIRLSIHLSPYSVKPKDDANTDREVHIALVEKYMTDTMYDLDGFELFDEATRYEIVFPAGWKHKK